MRDGDLGRGTGVRVPDRLTADIVLGALEAGAMFMER